MRGSRIGPGTSISVKLESAGDALNAGDEAAACGTLRALRNEATAQRAKIAGDRADPPRKTFGGDGSTVESMRISLSGLESRA